MRKLEVFFVSAIVSMACLAQKPSCAPKVRRFSGELNQKETDLIPVITAAVESGNTEGLQKALKNRRPEFLQLQIALIQSAQSSAGASALPEDLQKLQRVEQMLRAALGKRVSTGQPPTSGR